MYVFYKHALLHGLNVSLVFAPALNFSSSVVFRLYPPLPPNPRPTFFPSKALTPPTPPQLPLPARPAIGCFSMHRALRACSCRVSMSASLRLRRSYVLEFFLQTLVKKGHVPQRQMLRMQKVGRLLLLPARCATQTRVGIACSAP